MSDYKYNERDHLAWSRFMLINLAAIAIESNSDGSFAEKARARLCHVWQGLGAQGVEGAMLSMILTLESIGCTIYSVQTSPESGEIIVDSLPGQPLLDGLEDRFDIRMSAADWGSALDTDEKSLEQLYDIFGAIADAAGVEYAREVTGDGHTRLILRAW
jgi:hypothetical protein